MTYHEGSFEMSAHSIDHFLKQFLALSPEEQQVIRARLNAQVISPPADDFGKMMKELGIGKPRDPGARPPPIPSPLAWKETASRSN